MSKTTPKPNLRRQVIRAAEQANVPLDEWDRAQVLGQVAGLIAVHPKVGGMIAFKGGAIMHLIDGSPRLSKDLDASLVSGRRVTDQVIREALTTREARRIVISVGEFVSSTPHSLTFPVIVCHPISGQGRVALQLSINWKAPLLRPPVRKEITIQGRKISFLAVSRPERIAEKVRAFLVRDRPGDAFDLYHYAKQGITPEERRDLSDLVAVKLGEDDDVPPGDLRAIFDHKVEARSRSWTRDALVLAGQRPPWSEVGPRVAGFRRYIPKTRPIETDKR